MIQINLLPDVKRELIQAQRFRNIVISVSIVAAIVAVGVVVLLGVYVFGVQALRGKLSDDSIKTQFAKLSSQTDLDKALTLQNQISKVSASHENSTVDSRLFDILTTVISSSKQDIRVTTFSVDTTEGIITIEGEAPDGYKSLDALKKTLMATKFEYQTPGTTERQSIPLADQVMDGERSYGDSSSGDSVLRFNISFTYDPALLSRDSTTGKLIAPSVTNATDSALEVPSSIFSGGDK